MFHKILFPLTAAAFLLLSVSGLYCAGAIQIRLKETAHVAPGKVLLKDIASLHGADPEIIHAVGSLPITDSPEFGAVKTLSRHQVDGIIKKAQTASPGFRTVGAQIVQIRQKGRRITAEELTPVLRAFVMKSAPWREQEIKIHSFKNLEEIEVPAGKFDLRISERSPVFGKGKMLVSFDAVLNGKKLTSFWVTAGFLIRAEVLTAGKRIPYGKVIAPNDIVTALAEIEDPDVAYMRDAGEVIGKVSERSFSPGDPLAREAFNAPFLVNSGDTVHLRLERNGLVVISLARAEQDGRLGQVIRVRNLEFKNTLKATVTGRARVEMP